MLTVRIRVIMIAGLLIVFGWLIRQIQKKRLDLRQALSWLFLDVALLILALFPGILNIFARIVGIYSPVNMIFFCGFAFSLIVIYVLTVTVSKLSEEVKSLAQKIALLEEDSRDTSAADDAAQWRT